MSDEIRVTVSSYGPGRNLVMRYTDPVTGQRVPKSAGTTNRKEALKLAGQWQADLRAGKYAPVSRIGWQDFRFKYESEKLASLARKTQGAGWTAMNHLERVINPKRLSSVTSATISRFQAKLRKEGMKDTTIAMHLHHLRAALSWAVKMGMLPEVPEMHMPKRAKGKAMGGRPITVAEFDEMILATPLVRSHDSTAWERYLIGLWLSGLRLEESTVLSWDDDAPFAVDLSGKHPRFRIYAEAEKGHQDRLLPMTPDFAEWLLRTPETERTGRVFKLVGTHTGQPITPKRVSRIVSKIGETAGVVVNSADGKYSSCHDLRRTFGTRWASRVKPATLMRLMRHESVETTMRYYVDLDADELADELWANHSPGAGSAIGNTNGNTTPRTAPDSNEHPSGRRPQPHAR